MRAQRGSSATMGGELRDRFDNLFMIVIAVFSYRSFPILAWTLAPYTPILAFKSNIGHPIPAVAASLFGLMPIIALEQDIEPQVIPYLYFIICHCDVRRIDESYIAHDFGSASEMTGVTRPCAQLAHHLPRHRRSSSRSFLWPGVEG
jgi:hypothetical protein